MPHHVHFPRLRWALRHPAQAVDRQGIPPWLAAVVILVTGPVFGWLVTVYLSIRR
ncbi:hypothetical protein [Streptomyces lunalinharesii]|uniref:Uncharacterized protein n=1 Tax=Streptomyces lunalinharesii TaxID=333384 RepID=A0ABN3T6W2_9ACTN